MKPTDRFAEPNSTPCATRSRTPPQRPQPPNLKLGESLGDLPAEYSNDPALPTLLAVKVATPRLGLVWSNFEVAAEFSNDQIRTGMTGRNGMLGFMNRASEPAWRGAQLRRVDLSYPKGKVDPVWFDIDASRTKTLQVTFEPGSLQQTAFQTTPLKVQRESSGENVLTKIVPEESGRSGWKFHSR